MKAIWNDTVLAESDDTIVVEGNHYFPPKSVNMNHFKPSDTHTTCHWKGKASYHNIVDNNGEENQDAAWFYPEPSQAAENIKNYIAFWKGVEVTD